jgi:hypothetical protein
VPATTGSVELLQSGVTIVHLANDDTYAIRTITTTAIQDTCRGRVNKVQPEV